MDKPRIMHSFIKKISAFASNIQEYTHNIHISINSELWLDYSARIFVIILALSKP